MYMAREKSTVKVKTCVLYYVKHIVKVNDDFKGCHNLEHRSRVDNYAIRGATYDHYNCNLLS
jgi:hypothetical protein